MRLEYQILIAFVLDLLLGDPRWVPHPVRGIGWLAKTVEAPLRRLIRWERGAGLAAMMLTVSIVGGTAWALIALATWLNPWAGDVVSIVLLYTTFATRDLVSHARRVYEALNAGDLPESRRRVAMIVGRDTQQLSEPEVVRATVESVSESLVDGVTAPLFFAALGGPVGAMMYKAINTLDSTFGYKNERYLYFGWASARMDDAANWIPARLTAPLLAIVSGLFGLSPVRAWQTGWRDGGKHASPNAGWSEAVMAGALGVQLGGLNYYDGEPCEGPRFGAALHAVTRDHIILANRLIVTAALLMLLLLLAVRWCVWQWWMQGGGL